MSSIPTERLSLEEMQALIDGFLIIQKQLDEEYLVKLKATWPVNAKQPEMTKRNSPKHAEEYRRLMILVLASNGEIRWQRLAEKERQAVARCTWQLGWHPMHRRMIEEKGLDYVWSTIRQGPRLYGLE